VLETLTDVRKRLVLIAAVFVLTLCGAALVLCATPATAQAKPTVKSLSFQYKGGVKYATSTFKVDLNHKGGAEKVKVVPFFKGTRSGAKGLKFYIRGKKALTVKGKYASSWFSLHYLRLSKKHEYLLIGTPTKNAFMVSSVTAYELQKGKLVEVGSLSQKWGEIGKPTEVTDVLSATATSVQVVYSYKKSPLGNHQYKLTYTFDPETNTFTLTSKSASVYFGQSTWTATVSAKLYQNAGPASVTNADGTVTKNPVVGKMKKGAKVKKVRVSKDGYVRVTLKSGKTGWFKWAKYKKGKPFKGVKAV
jgi:hypothetical protein